MADFVGPDASMPILRSRVHGEQADRFQLLGDGTILKGDGRGSLFAERVNQVVTVSVADYGAKGDGSTDDTNAINSAITAASAAGSATRQVRVFFPDGTYLCDTIFVKSNVWIDFGNAVIRKKSNGSGATTNSMVRALETLTGATYYGTYSNIKITGGRIDGAGKTGLGAMFRLFYVDGLVIDGVEVIAYAQGAWAFQLGGRNGVIRNCRIRGGANLFEDGIHIAHGQQWRIIGNDIESGDDSIALGGEPTDPFLAADPDALRYVTVAGNVVKSNRAFALKVYVQSGATGTNWEVTDVNVSGLTGTTGILQNGGIWIEDYNGGLPPSVQIKRINVSDVALKVGSAGHNDSQAQGVHVFSASGVTLSNVAVEMTEGAGAASGFDLCWMNNVEDVTLDKVRTSALGKRHGVRLVNGSRVTVRGCRFPMTAGVTTSAPFRIQSSEDVKLLDNDVQNIGSGQYAVQITEGASSAVSASGNRFSRVSGSVVGYGFSVESAAVQRLIAEGNDFTGLIRGFLDESKLRAITAFVVRNNANQPDLLMTDAPFRRVFTGRNKFDAVAATGAGGTILHESGSAVPGGASGGFGIFHLDPAEFAVSGQSAKLRLSCLAAVNDTAPACDFTLTLRPVAAVSGAGATVTLTLGAAVSGSSATVSAPAADGLSRADSDFDCPAAGYYVVVLVTSANMAANSSVVVRGTLKARAL